MSDILFINNQAEFGASISYQRLQANSYTYNEANLYI